MRIRGSVAIALAVAGTAAALASGAYASFDRLPQQKLLDRGCNAAVPRIETMLNRAWATRILTVRTEVRLLRPGKLAGDIVFNPSAAIVSVAGDAPASGSVSFACGFAMAGNQGGSGTAETAVGPGLPTKHVVAVVHETFTIPGRYTLTFTLGAKGRRILAHLGAEERAYRRHHPSGSPPPTITWGIGLHYQSTG